MLYNQTTTGGPHDPLSLRPPENFEEKIEPDEGGQGILPDAVKKAFIALVASGIVTLSATSGEAAPREHEGVQIQTLQTLLGNITGPQAHAQQDAPLESLEKSLPDSTSTLENFLRNKDAISGLLATLLVGLVYAFMQGLGQKLPQQSHKRSKPTRTPFARRRRPFLPPSSTTHTKKETR